MKHLRQFCAVAVLTLTFTSFAIAGEMWGPAVVQLPPPPSAAGEMDTPSTSAIDPVTEVALDLFQSVLSLF